MKKIVKNIISGGLVSLLALSTFTLSGCGEEDDTTIYHNTFAFQGVPEELISSNDYHIQAVLYKENDDGELIPQDPALDSVDALYQSRVDLKAPFIPGYKFMGWIDDSGTNIGGLGDTNIKDGYDMWWNSYQKNGTLYAKYQLWTYNVVFGGFEKEGQHTNQTELTNGYQYNINKGTVTLEDGIGANDYDEFVNWYYVDNSSGQRNEVVITELPNDYFESTLVIFGNFKTKKFKVTAQYDSSKGSVDMTDALFTDGRINPHIDIISDIEWGVEYGYTEFYTSFVLTPNDGYVGASVTVDGEFKGNRYLEQGEETFTFGFYFDHAKDIVVNFEFFE